MNERDLLNRLNNQWAETGQLGSDAVRVYRDVTYVKAETAPDPSVYEYGLRATIINPATRMIHIVFAGDRGGINMATYNYTKTQIVIGQTHQRKLNL